MNLFLLCLAYFCYAGTREIADEADKLINHIEPQNLPDHIKNGHFLIFFGANWCKITQKFTPKWLTVQNEFDSRGWNVTPNFGIAKVECSGGGKDICESHKAPDFPTLNYFKDGVFVEEYMDPNEKDDIIKYLEKMRDLALNDAKKIVALTFAAVPPKAPLAEIQTVQSRFDPIDLEVPPLRETPKSTKNGSFMNSVRFHNE